MTRERHRARRRAWFRRAVCAAALCAPAGMAAAQSAAATSDSGGQTVSEIVVTATRHAENLSKVAQSVVALSEQSLDLRGIKDIQGVIAITPGLQFNANGFGTQADISIRGIDSQVGAATTGIYIDDTPIQTRVVGYSATNTYPLVFDLDRVEVLRGPQGTLFGAGSEGGTIRFITPQPSLTRYSTYARAEVSGTDGGDPSYEAGVAVGGPIARDVFGFRISLWDRHDGGYVDRKDADPELGGSAPLFRDANWSDTQVGRLAFVWAPAPNLTITPSIFYQNRNLNDIGTFWEGYSPAGAGPLVNGQPLRQPDHDHFILPALAIEYRLGGVTLISNTSFYQRTDNLIDDYSTLIPAIFTPPLNFVAGDTGYGAYAIMANKQTVWTEELRAQSADPDARLTWTTGVFLSESLQKSQETIVDPKLGEVLGAPPEDVLGLPLIDNLYSLESHAEGIDKQAAVFGEASWRILPQLKLTAGVRVARATFTGESFGTGAFVGATIVQPRSSTTETPVTPKFGLAWQMDEDNLFYATIAKGYRIGGTNAPLSTFCDIGAQGYSQVPVSYGSDSVWSYEIGAKNKLFGRTLEVDTSAYHIDWSNIQQLVYVSNCGQQFVDNLGSAVSNGFDIALSAHPIRGLTLDAMVGYDSATFSRTIPTLVQAGDHIDTQPLTANLGLGYEAPLFGDHQAYFRGDYIFHSKSAQTAITDPANGGYDPSALPAPPTNLLNLRAGLRWGGYDVSLFIDNVTNARPLLTRYSEVLGNPVHRDFTFRPLTAGLTAALRY